MFGEKEQFKSKVNIKIVDDSENQLTSARREINTTRKRSLVEELQSYRSCDKNGQPKYGDSRLTRSQVKSDI